MVINKITVGWVTQSFDTDKQEWINDGDPINCCDFEDRIVGNEPYLPFEMKQP